MAAHRRVTKRMVKRLRKRQRAVIKTILDDYNSLTSQTRRHKTEKGIRHDRTVKAAATADVARAIKLAGEISGKITG